MGGFPTNPPAPVPGQIVTITSVDATQFDTDGTVRIQFSYNGKNLGYRLKIKVVKHCRDHNFKFIPWKDCRPDVDLVILRSDAYLYDTIPATHLGKVFTFDASLTTKPTNDDECLWVFLKIEVHSGLDILPGFKGQAQLLSLLGQAQASAGIKPIMTWTIPFKVCCHDCELTCIFDPPDNE
jgi:hypothetical protein